MQPSIIIASRNPMFAEGLAACLHRAGYHTEVMVDEPFRFKNPQPSSPGILMVGPTHLDEAGCFRLCRAAINRWKDIKVIIVVTEETDSVLLADAVFAGASGHISGTADCQHILTAVTAVASGFSSFQHHVLQGVWTVEPLTEREHEVLRLMATDLTYAQIGERLGIGESTVQTHAQHVIEKLGVHDRQQATQRARRRGMV